MQQLCKEAPHVAQAIAGAIQEQKISPPKTQGPNLRVAPYPSKRRRSLGVDPSYRPSKVTKRKNCCLETADGSDHQSVFDPVQKKITSHAEELSRGEEEPLDESNQIRVVRSAPSSYHSFLQDDTRDGRKAVHWESTSLENVVTRSSEATSDSSGSVTLTPREIPASSPGRNSPSTAVANSNNVTLGKHASESFSLQTEELQRDRMRKAPGIANASNSPASETTFKELIFSLVKTIYELCNFKAGPPETACQSVLQSLREGRSYSNEWSDGATWMRMLGMGSSQQNKVTVSNMLIYIGIWEWFYHQVKYVQKSFGVGGNGSLGERKAKTQVLNEMQNRLQNSGPPPAAQEKWISKIGAVTLEENASAIHSKDSPPSVIAMAKSQQRSRIRTLLHRGKRLSTKLVKQLGRGILFHPKIWDYTKMSEEKLDDWINHTREDSKQKELWDILSPQLDQLVEKGSPDLQAFYDNLRKKELVTEKEINEMKMCYPLDSDALPDGKLEDAIMHLKKLVSSKVLGKDTIDTTDSIAVDGSKELTCDIFDRLRPTEWLDEWTIYLAMKISDRPSYVRFDTSILLEDQPEEITKNRNIKEVTSELSDCEVIEVRKTTPLAEWAKKIVKEQQSVQEKLVHFRPINYRNHFTLLEINAREGVIRHYDSLANHGIKETVISRLIKKEFDSFGFSYEEVETPQQQDGWSCGIRVIWNFRQLCYGIPIGSWEERLNPEPLLLEIVEGMEASVQGNAMRKYR
ncbi:hypothetical protein CBS11350_10019 [Aspergillus niger]|nr:hypothetical protein CBS11350_10019 [Aspergillus niger]